MYPKNKRRKTTLKTRDTACPFFRVIKIEQKKAMNKISLLFLEKDSILFLKTKDLFQKITF
jgi:hypothetical protein